VAGVTRQGRIYDITRPLAPGGIVYPGDIVPRFRQLDNGTYLITDMRMSTHSGTHIDAPSHYLEAGLAVDQIPFSSLMGWCRVLDMRNMENEITVADLAGRLEGADKVLLKTSFSEKLDFEEGYPALTPEAAALLSSRGMTCIGTDAPSIEGFRGNGDVHRALLSGGMVIIELLDLHRVGQGDYWMIALPLLLPGLDGSPCRVLLFEGWDGYGPRS
jgi:arylformamidase